MLFGVFGPNSPMTRWGLHLVRSIAVELLGPHDFAAVAVPNELKDALAKREHEHMVLMLESPRFSIIEMFQRSRAPVMMFAEDPLAMIAFNAIEKDLSPEKALQAVVQSLCSLEAVTCSSDTYLLTRPSRATSVRHVIQYVADFLNLTIDETGIDRVVARLAQHLKPRAGEDFDVQELVAAYTPVSDSLPAWFRGLPADEQRLLQNFRQQLAPALEGKSFQRFVWPSEIFKDTAAMDWKMPHPIELTGPTRIIFHGPYLCLPRGKWTASFFFEAIDTGAPNSILIDILVNQRRQLALGQADLTRDGNFRLDLRVEITEPSLPLEARMLLERGAIEGKVELQRVEFVRAG